MKRGEVKSEKKIHFRCVWMEKVNHQLGTIFVSSISGYARKLSRFTASSRLKQIYFQITLPSFRFSRIFVECNTTTVAADILWLGDHTFLLHNIIVLFPLFSNQISTLGRTKALKKIKDIWFARQILQYIFCMHGTKIKGKRKKIKFGYRFTHVKTGLYKSSN